VSRDAIIAAFGLSRRPTLRTNTIKATDDEIMAAFREAAIQFERVKQIPHAFAIKNRTGDDLRELPLAKDGKIYLQGLTSMLPPLILDPKPDAAILDLCAAPGSKTSQLAAMMNDRGAIVAYEQDSVRYQKLLNTLRIQGATNVETRMVDATLISHEYPETFDNILADVPCSAEGRINLNEPRSYRYWNEKNIVAHAKLQRRLLRSAVAMLKAGVKGPFGAIVSAVTRPDGWPDPAMYFWASGTLSSFLDNAPTYLVFFNTASGDPVLLMTALAPTLAAISAGAVFMGANTYIGNAPNLMVKAIAEDRGVKMPSFFGYMAWSGGILIPLFVVMTFIWFR